MSSVINLRVNLVGNGSRNIDVGVVAPKHLA